MGDRSSDHRRGAESDRHASSHRPVISRESLVLPRACTRFDPVNSVYVRLCSEEQSMSFDYERWKESQLSTLERDFAFKPAFPTSIMVAGLIWAAIGVFTLGTVAVLSSQTGAIRSPGAIMAGLFFLYGGVRTTSGASPGTLRGGIASMLLGFLWIGSGVIMSNLDHQSAGKLLLISGAAGGALLLAGFLAVIGRSSYQKWREAHASVVTRID